MNTATPWTTSGKCCGRRRSPASRPTPRDAAGSPYGRALALPVDVARADEVERAADSVEAVLGPVDVWINVAFTSVFAPFTEISAAELRRVTDVSYLGFVNGTRTALARMTPRDRGTIVQVGSALGERSIPLQSAYCGAKHAVNGSTSPMRTELLHQGRHVHLTVVQMPPVNTPQFSWARSRPPGHPQPVPPIYQPEVAARAVLLAADHSRRKQHCVGASTVATLWANRIAPALLDRYLPDRIRRPAARGRATRVHPGQSVAAHGPGAGRRSRRPRHLRRPGPPPVLPGDAGPAPRPGRRRVPRRPDSGALGPAQVARPHVNAVRGLRCARRGLRQAAWERSARACLRTRAQVEARSRDTCIWDMPSSAPI